MKKAKHNWLHPAIGILYFTAVFATSYIFAMERINCCDYVSINGDFQSYNVFRRIFDGQTPYVDFANYIGMAPVFVNMPFLAFSHTFADSLFVTTFTTNVLFCLAVFMVFFLITKNATLSCLVSALIPKLIHSEILSLVLGPKYGYIFSQRFIGLYTPSNSMRGARSFLPFLLLLLAALFGWLYQKATRKPFRWIDRLSGYRALAAVGAAEGIFIVWSNDFGIACIAATLLMLIFLQCFRYRLHFFTFANRIAAFFAFAAIGLLGSSTLITNGHPAAWFQATAQTMEYQFFYFNGTEGKALLPYIFSKGELWIYSGILIAFLLYCLYRLIHGTADDKTLSLVFIAVSMLAATFIYICGGSGYNFREALEVYAILFVLGCLCKMLLYATAKHKKVIWTCLSLSLLLLSSYNVFQAVTYRPQPYGTYVDELGGTTPLTGALQEAKAYINGESVFSVYATGLETVTNQFQPTGYDYIIHALGKDTQEKYADVFLNGHFKYVQTPRMEIGIWAANQNWYLYRNILKNYKMDFATEYSWIWKEAEIPAIKADVKIEINRVSDSTVQLLCTSTNTDTFVADVAIEYDTSFDSMLHQILAVGRKAICVNTTCCVDNANYAGLALPGQSREFIPVKMENGTGVATITGAYGDGVNLSVKTAQFVQALPGLCLARKIG